MQISIFHLLEQGKVCPTDDTFKECIKQSIKFHNNAIAKVFLRNYPQKDEDTFVSSIQFFNYLMFPEKFIEFLNGIEILDEKPNVLFYYLIQYDHINLVDSILKSQKLNLNAKIISILLFFIKFKNKFFLIKFQIILFHMVSKSFFLFITFQKKILLITFL